MKKRIALLALVLTLCGSFAAFPVSAHAAEIEIQNQTLTSEAALTEETAVKSEMYTFPLNEYHLNK